MLRSICKVLSYHVNNGIILNIRKNISVIVNCKVGVKNDDERNKMQKTT